MSVHSLLSDWDGVELWLSTLAFPLQVAVMLAVLGPLSYGLARLAMAGTDAAVNTRIVRVLRGRDDAVEEEN